MFLAFDVGNSGIKVALFDGDSLVAAARLADPAADPATVLGFDVSVIDISGAERAAVSVNDPLLEAFLSGSGRGTPVLGRD
ncbi:MAG: hypothetical protein ABFS86_21225, partial [Planctomycetota bacterium]